MYMHIQIVTTRSGAPNQQFAEMRCKSGSESTLRKKQRKSDVSVTSECMGSLLQREGGREIK